eukprot:CAMPEP_0175128094 /NCGR_PEP_ID=MMETSP0087-20121206/4744_1 /TAXON_ID=136419 /ORGANISM="Unknown Unknown, Strain D1" /LENGTH=293 /DNA_ID=CAMNT_0016410131 /DNA_START=10 /DNA_END=891 /DNA_ORIENTATION=+
MSKRKLEEEDNAHLSLEEIGESMPPCHLKNAFNPEELTGCHPKGYCGMLQSLCERLPIQMHFEPCELDEEGAPPLFKRCVALLRSKPELKELMDVDKARVKLRLSGKGKFVHRNRYRRRNIICCLDGEQWWLFVKSAAKDANGVALADTFLNSTSNKNWNGYRSNAYPKGLSLEEMKRIASEVHPDCEAKVLQLKAGDVMTFDGRWWHATQYDSPVLNLFFTPGKDMEVAVREHHRRMAMPFQKGLKIATINMAKCSKLSGNWQQDKTGAGVEWGKLEKEAEEGKAVDDEVKK